MVVDFRRPGSLPDDKETPDISMSSDALRQQQTPQGAVISHQP